MMTGMGKDSADFAAHSVRGPLLGHELARSARAQHAALPVLRHLLASEEPSLVNEAVVARVRGMLRDLAGQVLAGGRAPLAPGDDAVSQIDALAESLAGDDVLLAHVHALALEGQLAERFEQRLSLDPVLSPLLQELIASDDAIVAELAMTTLAAQARFIQSQRRMELPLGELPAELLHRVIARSQSRDPSPERQRLAALAASYDEAATRIGLIERLVSAMRRAAMACLAFDRAGLALFAQGLAALAGVPRAGAVLACHEGQAPRLALMLRAAGQDSAAIERQLLLISAPGALLRDVAELTAQQARARLTDDLTASSAERGG